MVEPMRVRTALGLINQVLDQVLDEQEQDFDAETRWAIHWFSQFFFDEGPYGTAEQLAVSMNVAVGAMVEVGNPPIRWRQSSVARVGMICRATGTP